MVHLCYKNHAYWRFTYKIYLAASEHNCLTVSIFAGKFYKMDCIPDKPGAFEAPGLFFVSTIFTFFCGRLRLSAGYYYYRAIGKDSEYQRAHYG
ncbi:hypothetical protein GCM10028774_44870 [Spirosoma jeollabukense]